MFGIHLIQSEDTPTQEFLTAYHIVITVWWTQQWLRRGQH